MKNYTEPTARIIKTDPADLLTTSGGGLTLASFTLGEENGIGDLTKWKG